MARFRTESVRFAIAHKGSFVYECQGNEGKGEGRRGMVRHEDAVMESNHDRTSKVSGLERYKGWEGRKQRERESHFGHLNFTKDYAPINVRYGSLLSNSV